MWLDRVSNPGPLTYESGALPTALHSPASRLVIPFKIYMVVLVQLLNWAGFVSYHLNP